MSSLARVLTLSMAIAFCATTSVPSFAGPEGPHGKSASGATIDSNKGGERRGLDRADDVAGDHGRQGRETARDNQDRHVAPADLSDCKKGGWRSFGFGFKNEGECVSHITAHRQGRETARDNQDRRVGPTEKSDCKKGGWRSFGFKNQGQCVSHITAHRK